MSEQVVIARRFNGPPGTAHGGYACAVAAQFLDWSAEVSLRMPPPLEHPLSVHRDDDRSVTLLDGEAVVVQAKPAGLHLDVPDPVSLAEAEAAAAACPWLERHPFPTCFGCGPERSVGDGMREFPGSVAGRDALGDALGPGRLARRRLGRGRPDLHLRRARLPERRRRLRGLRRARARAGTPDRPGAGGGPGRGAARRDRMADPRGRAQAVRRRGDLRRRRAARRGRGPVDRARRPAALRVKT